MHGETIKKNTSDLFMKRCTVHNTLYCSQHAPCFRRTLVFIFPLTKNSLHHATRFCTTEMYSVKQSTVYNTLQVSATTKTTCFYKNNVLHKTRYMFRPKRVIIKLYTKISKRR